jgi:hypothetical protein
MLRRVAFGKAVIAGAAGALAWELVARVLILFRVPVFDLVYLLGTMVSGPVDAWKWWPVGMTVHATVGAIWAIFYAYFFWSDFNWSPAMQGLVFSFGAAILAGLIMVPQMGFMHVMILQGQLPYPRVFGIGLGWAGPVGIVVGHLIYGTTMGSLYIKPVGFKVRRLVSNG